MTPKSKAKLAAAAVGLLLPLALSAHGQASVIGSGLSKGFTAHSLAARAGVCSRRAGPYVTQSTAYARRRQAMARGFRVSGVFPNNGGYAFNVFFAC